MKRFYYTLTALLLLSGISMHARSLNPAEAMERAVEWSSAKSRGMMKAPAMSQMKLAYTAEAEKSAAPAFYVFSKADDGFMIVSADDRLPAVLGYTDSGSFDYEAIPDNLRWWLGEYRKEIDAFLSSATIVAYPAESNKITARTDRKTISPLVTTKWNQDSPYNDLCPMDTYGRSYSGCVATAMAQVMNYHKWPIQGKGQHSYVWKNKTLDFDFANTTFAWENMLNVYNSDSAGKSKRAVATLMYGCGVGTNMQYSSSGSGAYDLSVIRCLTEFMDYNPAMQLIFRDNYPLAEWQEIVYAELEAGRPLYYSGVTADGKGGHAFVCDGYAGNDYFHFNWGWGGQSDGNFLLTALDPHSQGIGGFDSGYNTEQSIVTGICKNEGQLPIPSLMCDGEFTCTSSGSFTLTSLGNYSSYDINIDLGVMVTTDNPYEGTFFSGKEISMEGFNVETLGYGWVQSTTYRPTVSGLKPGKYTVYPAFKNGGAPATRICCPVTNPRSVSITVSDNGSIVYGDVETEAKIKVVEFYPVGEVYANTTTKFFTTVENTGNATFAGAIVLRIVDEQGFGFEGNVQLAIDAGKRQSFYINVPLENISGKASANFYDEKGQPLNDQPFTFTVAAEPPAPVTAPVTVTGIDNDRFYYGHPSAINISFKCGENASTERINVSIVNSDSKETAFTTYFNYNFPANQNIILGLPSLKPELPLGNYIIVFSDGDGSPISEDIPVYAYVEEDGFWYGLRDGGLSIPAPYEGSYRGKEGILNIPATVTIGGATYNVTSLEAGSMAGISGVSSIFLNPAVCPFSDADAVFPKLSENVSFYVNGSDYASYSSLLAAWDCYSIIENMVYYQAPGASTDITLGCETSVVVRFETQGDASAFVNPNVTLNCSDLTPDVDAYIGLENKSDISLYGDGDNDSHLFDSNGIIEAQAGEFSDGTLTVSIKGIGVGVSDLAVVSKQPGKMKSVTIPVTVGKESGVKTIDNDSVIVTVTADSILISGLQTGESVGSGENGATIELYTLQGVKVASAGLNTKLGVIEASAEGCGLISLPRPASGVYILRLSDRALRLIL